MSAVKTRALIGEEWDPVPWDRDVWEDAVESENSQGFISPKKLVSKQKMFSYSAPRNAAFSSLD